MTALQLNPYDGNLRQGKRRVWPGIKAPLAREEGNVNNLRKGLRERFTDKTWESNSGIFLGHRSDLESHPYEGMLWSPNVASWSEAVLHDGRGSEKRRIFLMNRNISLLLIVYQNLIQYFKLSLNRLSSLSCYYPFNQMSEFGYQSRGEKVRSNPQSWYLLTIIRY
jgi:hypothetical protein